MHRKYQCFLDFYYGVWKIFFGFCCPQFEKQSFWLRSCHRQSGLKKVLNRSLSQSLPLTQKGGGGCGPQNAQRIANPARGGCLFHAVAQSPKDRPAGRAAAPRGVAAARESVKVLETQTEFFLVQVCSTILLPL